MSIKLFDSRDPAYRRPFGAVKEGSSIHFRIKLPRYLGCKGATLVISDDINGALSYSNMFWCGMENDEEWWEVDYTFEKASLYFYYFALDTNSGARYLSRTRSCRGELVSFVPSSLWQITAYEKDFKTPDWLSGGIIYQIFPDSFRKSGREHENVPDDRIIQGWDEVPHWQPDENGKITNRHYYGGDLAGITEKLDYIKSLGVTCIYLNPIFEAHENHRYNTGDYSKIDPLLGTSDDLKKLKKEAEKRGIKLIFDGVFSHTGADSKYFNRSGRYDSVGAYNSQSSPYYPWYNFKRWPDDFDSWWGITTLPELREDNEAVLEYFAGDGGILQRWLDYAKGWRLDVADELPDIFLDRLRAAVKAKDKDAVIIGEVWEDASNKCAYSRRRRYLLGKQLDSVMNYPFKDAIIGFLTGVDASDSVEIIMTIIENYPPHVCRLLMNSLGTHDTERILTALAGESSRGCGRDWQASHHLSPEQYATGIQKLKMASLMQYTLPGVPSIYYGDEAGLEGYRDPFNRHSFPWGKENTDLLEWYRYIGKLRGELSCLAEGYFHPVWSQGNCLAYMRMNDKEAILAAFNAGQWDFNLQIPDEFIDSDCLIGNYTGGKYIRLKPLTCSLLRVKRDGLKEKMMPQ